MQAVTEEDLLEARQRKNSLLDSADDIERKAARDPMGLSPIPGSANQRQIYNLCK